MWHTSKHSVLPTLPRPSNLDPTLLTLQPGLAASKPLCLWADCKGHLFLFCKSHSSHWIKGQTLIFIYDLDINSIKLSTAVGIDICDTLWLCDYCIWIIIATVGASVSCFLSLSGQFISGDCQDPLAKCRGKWAVLGNKYFQRRILK